jgi:hypothetical protein
MRLLISVANHPAESPSIPYNGLHLGLGDLNYPPMDSSPLFNPAAFPPVDSIPPSALVHHSPPALSASELSADGAHSSRRSSTGSPDSGRGNSLPPASGRAPAAGSGSERRYNPISSTSTPRTRASKKRASKADESDDDDEDGDFQPITAATTSDKREEIRRQRIESEQRRRDELREGYKRLKDALPPSNQKSSKVSLLDRGEFPLFLSLST